MNVFHTMIMVYLYFLESHKKGSVKTIDGEKKENVSSFYLHPKVKTINKPNYAQILHSPCSDEYKLDKH